MLEKRETHYYYNRSNLVRKQTGIAEKTVIEEGGRWQMAVRAQVLIMREDRQKGSW